MTQVPDDTAADPWQIIADLQRKLDERIAELSEAQEQQTATAEILQIINSSPGDLAPVFDAMLEKAMRLCEAAFGGLTSYDGKRFHNLATRGLSLELAEVFREPFIPQPGSFHYRLANGEALVHGDHLENPSLQVGQPQTRGVVELGSARTGLVIALQKDERLIGSFWFFRQEPRPFSEKQIALLQNFAAQAVIAIENARLITETREALEQQTATAEVLQVINSSPGDLRPVFDAVLEKAMRLCGAAFGILAIYEGRQVRTAATRGVPVAFVDFRRNNPPDYGPGTAPARVLAGEHVVHVVDLQDEDIYRTGDPNRRAIVDLGGARTMLLVPLLKEDAARGHIGVYRQEVRAFSDKQIALLQNFAAQAVIAIENARLITETREALEQQTATAEVLGVINSSPGDLAPVFDAMLERAFQLCEAQTGHLMRYENGEFNRAASFGGLEDFDKIMPRHQPLVGIVTRDSVPFRTLVTRTSVHVLDMAEDASYRAGAPAEVAGVQAGIRTALFVPLLRDGEVIGNFVMHRREKRPFTDKQIALVENFAAQAVIAIENTRLINETREALDQQTATAEVLQVINSSPGELSPVFDAILDKAMGLCEAAFGFMSISDGASIRSVATRGVPAAYAEFRLRNPPPASSPIGSRVLKGEPYIHTVDLKAESSYQRGNPQRRALVDLGEARTSLAVTLMRDRTVLGAIHIYRKEVRPFTEKQIALLENFAAQAVIAIENARLITETREALDQQTATAEVLGVINSSPGDLAPVFDVMLERATRLSEATFGILWTYDEERYQAVSFRNVPPAYAEFLCDPVRAERLTALGRVAQGEAVAHIPDIATDEYLQAGGDLVRQGLSLGRFRAVLAVPMRKDETLLGAITIYRQEPLPFSDKQIGLLQSFAAQAVIAMENARLLGELRERTGDLEESLDYQTATSDVLKVISRSTFDLQPVFETIVETATRLCDADAAIITNREGDGYRLVATFAAVPEYDVVIQGRFFPAERGSLTGRVALEGQVVHINDIASDREYTQTETVTLQKSRTMLGVPLLREGVVVGTINLGRTRVQPFTDRQIELVRTFADQAVIALENARLITETREALEQQTATSEVLAVINSSPGDLVPVFEAMLEKAMRLCEAAFGSLWTNSGDRFLPIAHHGVPSPYAEFLAREVPAAGPGTGRARLLAGEPFAHIADLANEEPYRAGEPHRRALVDLGGARSALLVPLRKDEAVIGFIMIYRQEVHPFTDKQIALLQNFAAQAVIAMENARLLTETREALDQQTATAEVLGVINSSPGDLEPVFKAILDKAHTLCGATRGTLFLFDGETFRAVVTQGYPEGLAEQLRQGLSGSQAAFAPLLAGARLVHIPDLSQIDDPLSQVIAERGGVRTNLLLPLRKDGALLGMISCNRHEVRPFADREIALLENFAAQAVIAMENARLITETREALDQQTATAEVLGVINSSPGDLAPVFDAILEKAHALCGATFGSLQTYDGEFFRTVASRGLPDTLLELLREPFRPDPNSFEERLVRGDDLVHIPDVTPLGHLPDDPLSRTAVETVGLRTLLLLPLRKEAALVGYVASARSEVRPFTDKQIALLQSFAAQAVIAMENARLLDEVRQRQQELRVTFDNMADGVVMFDEDLRLAAWNRNFQELLDLPDALLAERLSYADYLRTLAERGEFGTEDIEAELKRRLESTDQEFRTERTRPDGRVIEVRRNAVPDGGFVLIYSDITERKRSEAEIRAARDAAEATLRDLRAAQANLIQAEKMASLGQLTAGIAHEIKNPLNFVNNFASLSVELLDELKETTASAISSLDKDKQAEVDETMVMLTGNLEKIAEHGKRADNIVKSMLEHSRGVSGERREVDLNGVIEEALNLAYHGARAHDQTFNITLERDYANSLRPIEVAPQEITRVFLNLFGNGFYAANKRSHENGAESFRPCLTVATRDAEDAVEVRVRDNGDGIPAEIRDKLFQPFFTTKPTGEGTGLGLSISYDIITQQHGGTIEVDSRVGEFTEFTIRLPRTMQAASTGTPA